MIEAQPDPLVGIGMTMAVLVASLFATAAVTKAMAPSATVAEATALGVPLPRLAARLLPPVELVVAGLLVAVPRSGAMVALLFLAAFTAVLVRAIRAGTTVSCGCLGALSREPVTYSTVARNGVLAAMAAAALAVPAPVVPDLASAMAAVSVVLIAFLAIQLLSLRYRIGRVWSVALAGEAVAGEPVAEKPIVEQGENRQTRGGT
jgi:hypothetical protein